MNTANAPVDDSFLNSQLDEDPMDEQEDNPLYDEYAHLANDPSRLDTEEQEGSVFDHESRRVQEPLEVVTAVYQQEQVLHIVENSSDAPTQIIQDQMDDMQPFRPVNIHPNPPPVTCAAAGSPSPPRTPPIPRRNPYEVLNTQEVFYRQEEEIAKWSDRPFQAFLEEDHVVPSPKKLRFF
jgi:hypothetical protein